MDFLSLAADRYSVRKFKNTPVRTEDIDKILKSALLAPTGCNNQPQRILVLTKEESLDKLKKCTKCHFDAPCAMIVCYNEFESWQRKYDGALSAPVDADIVATHMMLTAHSIGVGSTWVMYFDPDEMKKQFSFPLNIVPRALLVMGYPADDAEPLELHYKSKELSDIVRYESFLSDEEKKLIEMSRGHLTNHFIINAKEEQ